MNENIWEKILTPREEIRYQFSISKKFSNFMTIFCVLVGVVLLFTRTYFVGLIIIFISIFYFKYLIFWTNKFAFTNKRILLFRGWLASDLISIYYDKITDIVIEQSLLGKILNYGSLLINTPSSSDPSVKEFQKIENIDNPYHVKNKLEEIKEKK